MPDIISNRGHVWSVTAEGDGSVLLFIHGWAGDRRIWRQQVSYFSRRWRVVVPDLPGHGHSPWVPLSLDDLAEETADVAAKAAGRPLENGSVVASSMGGLVALRLLALHPGCARSLCLCGASPRFVRSEDFPFGLALARIRKLAEQVREEYPAILNIFFRSLFTTEERGSARYKWLTSFGQSGVIPDKKALLAYLRLLEKTDLREFFKSLQIPVLAIGGSDDYICPPDVYGLLKEGLPSLEVKVLEGCGHFPFITRAEEFNRYLDGFLQREGQP